MTTFPTNAKARLPKIHLDKSLVGRLEALASSMMRRSPEVGERLMDEIARAKLVAPDKLHDDVVTIGSEVTYRDLSSDRMQTVFVVYPEDADIDQHRISVLTPVGVALLGLARVRPSRGSRAMTRRVCWRSCRSGSRRLSSRN